MAEPIYKRKTILSTILRRNGGRAMLNILRIFFLIVTHNINSFVKKPGNHGNVFAILQQNDGYRKCSSRMHKKNKTCIFVLNQGLAHNVTIKIFTKLATVENRGEIVKTV